MAHTLKDKYIEPMVKEKSHRHKRSDSGYGGTASDRSSRRYNESRRSTDSTNGSRGYAEADINMANQRYDLSALQNALQASNESNERLLSEKHELDSDLTHSNSENRRLRKERDEERRRNEQLAANLDSAKKEIERQSKEISQYQKESKKSTKSSNSKEKKVPEPLYRSSSPPPRNARPTSSSNSRPSTSRRMSVSSQAPYTATYTLRPANYGQYAGQS